MASTTVTFRTDEELKKNATEVFDALGMNLSVAINLFMRQAVLKQRFPCSLELEVANGFEATYPPHFFDLFGSGRDLGLDEEPSDMFLETDGELPVL